MPWRAESGREWCQPLPFWACQPLAGILENETSRVRHISVHSSPSPASSYLHVANGQTEEALKKKKKKTTSIWNQYMFTPELLGLKYTYKSNLLLKLYTMYLFQVIPQTHLEFILLSESLAYSCQYLL